MNSSLQGGEKYDKMRKSIVVSIIDGKLFPELESFHNIFAVRGKTADCCSATEWSFIFELEKIDVTKPVRSLTEVERLGAYLKYAGDEEYQDYVRQILSEEDMDMTENTYRKVSQDELEYERREARIEIPAAVQHRDIRGKRAGTCTRPQKKGTQKGEAAGLKKARQLVLKRRSSLKAGRKARKKKRTGAEKEYIAKVTGLTREKVEML